MGYDRNRLFLKIVGRKRVILRLDKGLEKSPGPPSGQTEHANILLRERLVLGGSRRQAYPISHHGREYPEKDEWRRNRPNFGRLEGNHDAYHYSKRTGVAHAAIAAAEAELETGFCLCCRHPLEEIATGHIDARESPYNRVSHQPCLIGK